MRNLSKYNIVSAIAALALVAGFLPSGASAQDRQNTMTIDIGLLSTTHVLFTSDLIYVDISIPDVILSRVVDQSKNLLAIKARKEFDFVTTVSALEANGTMHTFYVRFNPDPKKLVIDTRLGADAGNSQVNTQIRPEAPVMDGGASSASADRPSRSSKPSRGGGRPGHPGAGNGIDVTGTQTSNFGRGNAPTIEEVMQRPAGLFHVVDKCYGLVASCENVFAYSDVMYFVISLKNDSDIGYLAGAPQFAVETNRSSTKSLISDKRIFIKSSYGTLSCSPRSESKIGFTVPKVTLQKNEVLIIYIYENGGNRNMFLSLDPKDINFASSPI